MNLEGRVAMITGAGRGIGLAIAKTLAAEGVRVALCDVDESLLNAARDDVATVGGDVLAFRVDVTDKAGIAEAVATLVDRFKRIDILVNNAGIYEVLSLEEISERQWDRLLAVNLKGAFLCTQAVLPIMKEHGEGSIVNMTSSAAKTGGLLCGAHYAASKAGIIALTKSVAREVAPHGIRVNAIAPGRIDTPMIHTVSDDENEAFRQQIPLGRVGTAEEIADAVRFLVSDAASYITGEILDVNGGALMD